MLKEKVSVLDNVLLYLSSAMAQVWAALLVYEELKQREELREQTIYFERTISEV